MMINIPWIKPLLGDEEEKALIETYRTGWITQGKQVEALEEELRRYIGCKHVVCVSNGTAAMLMCYLIVYSMFSTRDTKLFFPMTSFIATVYPALILGYWDFEFIDIKRDFLIDKSKLEIKMSHTSNRVQKVIVPVHIAGNVVEINSFDKDCLVIEDACQALGSEYEDGTKVGSNSYLAAFSLHVGKLITSGEGGFITTNDDIVYNKLLRLRNHGLSKDYISEYVGLNCRMTDMQASIGRVQLRKIDSFIEHRKVLVKKYNDSIDNNGILSTKKDGAVNAFMPAYIKNVEEFIEYMRNEYIAGNSRIDVRRFFPPFDMQFKLSKNFSSKNTIAEEMRNHVALLPIGNGHTVDEIKIVCEKVNRYLRDGL